MTKTRLIINPRWPKPRTRLASLMILLSSTATAQSIDWHSIDAGGGISDANGIQLIGVIGQSDSVRMSGGNLSLSGGYLPLPPDLDAIFKDGFEQ